MLLKKQEKGALFDFIADKGLQPVKLINTHCHIDHVLGNAFVKNTYDIPLLVPQRRRTHPAGSGQLRAELWFCPSNQESKADHYIKEGEWIKFGNNQLLCIWVPGHSPGHLVFYNEPSQLCIGGDALFKGSIAEPTSPGGPS